MENMSVPTIHLNGTSADELIDRLIQAREALSDALDALAYTAPNGRDYYPQGPDAFARANNEHVARWRAVNQVHADLGDLAEAIDAQRTRREADKQRTR